MPQPVEPVTTALLSLALSAATLRQQVTSANLSHAGTPGHQRLAVDFDAQLVQARAEHAATGLVQPASLAGVRPAVEQSGGEVHLDAEMARMARQSVHHQALLQGLSRHLALLASAAGDGRR